MKLSSSVSGFLLFRPNVSFLLLIKSLLLPYICQSAISDGQTHLLLYNYELSEVCNVSIY
jgi:hypothetical protein